MSNPSVVIGQCAVGLDHPTFVTAEVGINANGDVSIAKQLIDIAVAEGCSAVKFQMRDVLRVFEPTGRLNQPWKGGMPRKLLEQAIARGVLPDENIGRLRESSFASVTESDFRWTVEFTLEEYRELARYCRGQGILWFASPWDCKSVDNLVDLGVPCLKVASASLSDDVLIRFIASKRKPVILATGMSTMEEVRHAVSLLDRRNLILMHCVSTYPSRDSELNLSFIRTLQEEFPDVPVGWSGHEEGTRTSAYAVAIGACVVERHITLDRKMFGPDQKASVDPKMLSTMMEEIRSAEESRGDGVKVFLEAEQPIRKYLQTRS